MPRQDDTPLARFLDAVAGSVPDALAARLADGPGPRLLEGTVTGVLMLLYVAFVVGLCFPILVGTGGALYYLDHLLGLEGAVRTAYFALGVVVVMVEFTLLRRVVDAVGDRLFGEMRDPAWQQ